MADEYILKHLEDIRLTIEELESFFKDFPKRLEIFVKNNLLRSAVERQIGIIGEALVRIRKHDSNFIITNSEDIISIRNKLIYAYDSIKLENIWELVVRHIPELKKDIGHLINEELEKGNCKS